MIWKKILITLTLLIFLSISVWQHKYYLLAYNWLIMATVSPEYPVSSIGLPDYKVSIEGHAVEGIIKNLSGLSFNAETGTLFAVTNSEIIELTPDGRFLREILVEGAQDLEDITHISGNTYIICDERNQKVYRILIDDDVKSINLENESWLKISIGFKTNNGFEGVAWDSDLNRLYLAKEKDPIRIFYISGLLEAFNKARFNLSIVEWKKPWSKNLFVKDISALTIHAKTGNLLLLSDESAMVVEYDSDGKLIGMLPLWQGWHGLSKRPPQAEGIAIDNNGTIYMTSEPNLFYRFERQKLAPI